MANTAKTRTTKTAATEQPTADLSALVASGHVTIEVIDVATAELDPNIRTESTYSPEFVDSIRAEGVKEPVYARRGDDGTVYVWDGQRRTLAAKEAGVATMLGLFGLTPATVAGSARILDQLRTFNRADLSQADRIAAYEQLALDGIKVEQIARATGHSKDKVKATLTVAKSTTATQAAKDYGQVSLDRLLLIAEFDGDEAACDTILNVDDEDDLAYVAQEIRDSRATAQAEAALVEKFAADGYQVFTKWGGFSYLSGLTDAAEDMTERPALTEETHTSCEGRGIYLSVWGAGEDDYRADQVCAQSALHRDRYARTTRATLPDESDQERQAREDAAAEAARTERARVLRNNKAWRTAVKVRRDWITGLLARKALPKDAGVFVALSLTTHAATITGYQAADLVGSFLGQKDSHYRGDAAKLVDATPTKAGHVSLAVVLAAREACAEDVNGWRHPSQTVSSYLLALEAWGYKLSPVEKIAAGYSETDNEATDAEADTTSADAA
ncbi:ParB/RepB/Spo0J family partition protein [Leifsonia sp. NPDC102414]|uniref:ParB/RepB/Spo0J family partition protein n=1 Tax=Leifsonia sp. NPDC102414 TaxID=3364124 RepID=UPI003815FEB5